MGAQMRRLICGLVALYSCSCVLLVGVETKFVPQHYDLHFVLDPVNGTLSGHVKCRVFVANKTADSIELFADQSIIVKNVTITSDKLTNNFTKARVDRRLPNQLEIIPDQKFTKTGIYELTVMFEGIKASNVSRNSSFYVLKPMSPEGNDKWFYIIDLTKNESRSVFPSFCLRKYGHYKTSFNLTIIRPKSFQLVTVSSSSNPSQLQNKKNDDSCEVSNHQTMPIRLRSFALIATNTSHIYTASKPGKRGNIMKSLYKCGKKNSSIEFYLTHESKKSANFIRTRRTCVWLAPNITRVFGEVVKFHTRPKSAEYKLCPQSKLIFGLNKDTLVCILYYLSDFYGAATDADNMGVVAIPDTLQVGISAFGVQTISENAVNYTSTNPAIELQYLINEISGQWWTHSTDGVHPSADHLISSFSWLAVSRVLPRIITQSNASEYDSYFDLLEWFRFNVIKTEWRKNKTESNCYFADREILTLNMIEGILGEKLFAEGLAGLFSKPTRSCDFSESISCHGLIREEDIWKNLTRAAMENGTFDAPDFPQSVEEITQPFLNRSIFAIPLLEFDFEFYGSFGGFIRQTPYAFTRSSYDSRLYANSTTDHQPWKVPVQLVMENDKFVSQRRPFVWSKTRNRAIALTNFSQKEILLLNPDLRGPFVVKYSKNNWDRIFEKFDDIPAKYKIQLLHDIHVLAESSHYNYTEYISNLLKIKASKENLPIWKEYVALITDVEQKLSGKAKHLIGRLFVDQLGAVYEKFLNLSQADQPFWMRDLHDQVERYLCQHGVPVCNRTSEFERLMNNIRHPKKSLIGIHSCAAMQNISHEQYLQLLRNVSFFYKNYTFCQSLKVINLLTGCSENQNSLTTFLDVVFKDKEYSSSIFIRKLAWILHNVKKTDNGSSALFGYFTQNWKEIIRNFPRLTHIILKYATTNLKTREEIEKAITLLKSDEMRRIDAKETLEDNVHKLEEQLNWNETILKEIEGLYPAEPSNPIHLN